VQLLEFHLEVSDLDSSVEFYTSLLDYEKKVDFPDGQASVLILADGSAFGLWEKGKEGLFGGRGGEHVHFAFKIRPEEYDAYRSKLEELNMNVMEHDWPKGHKSLYFFDRDGHQGEFMTVDWLTLQE
jgi:catechol 2,3-dioxygenase-like lactoylglutathione lyase family enzyme